MYVQNADREQEISVRSNSEEDSGKLKTLCRSENAIQFTHIYTAYTPLTNFGYILSLSINHSQTILSKCHFQDSYFNAHGYLDTIYKSANLRDSKKCDKQALHL